MEEQNVTSNDMEKEQQNFLEELFAELNSARIHLNEFVEGWSMDHPNSILDPELDLEIEKVQAETRQLENNIHLLLKPLPKFIQGNYEKVETRFEKLHGRLQEQQAHLGSVQAENLRLKNQIQHQSTYCTSLGAVLGNLVWRASRHPQVIETWLAGLQNKVGEFLSIVNGSVVSFLNIYGAALPPMESDETQFVLGLCGIVTNISSCPLGRQFLVTNQNGRDLLQKLLGLILSVPLPSGNSLLRLMVMIMYNASINETGLCYLLELRVGEVIGGLLDGEAPQELKSLCLRLLQSITYDLSDDRDRRRILNAVPPERIEEFAKTEPVAAEILKQLKKQKDERTGNV